MKSTKFKKITRAENGDGMSYEQSPFKISASAGRISKKYHIINPIAVIKSYIKYWIEVVLK